MSYSSYSWSGSYQCPGIGEYVICDKNGNELEPYQVIDLLNAYDDLQEQIKNSSKNNEFKENTD